ncbi:MAG: hypothetical protein C5B51_17190 [Terriglobia bacterium]|nr:MAG: hypothetical protein C5B51_17190 [Terriglobia bacterium]
MTAPTCSPPWPANWLCTRVWANRRTKFGRRFRHNSRRPRRRCHRKLSRNLHRRRRWLRCLGRPLASFSARKYQLCLAGGRLRPILLPSNFLSSDFSGRVPNSPASYPKTEIFMACQTSLPLPQALASEMTLFELDETLCLLMESAMDATGENNGEIPGDLRQALLDYCEAFGAKVDNIANYIKSQENQASNAKGEIERLQSRVAVAENKVDRLKGLVKYFMETRGLRSMKGTLNTISLRKNSQDSLIVERPDAIPPEYWRVSLTIACSELQDILNHLPEQHPVRARLAADGNGSMKREPDNTKLRSALASGITIQGVELRRGMHVRLT